MSANYFYLLLNAIFIFVVFSGCSSGKVENSQSSIEGVWSYIEDDVLDEVKGMSFFTDNHFAFIVNFKTDSSDSVEQVLAHSGNYVLQDSIVTATIKYSHNTALIGQNIRWIHGVSGNTAIYKVLDKDGNVVESGKVKRLE